MSISMDANFTAAEGALSGLEERAIAGIPAVLVAAGEAAGAALKPYLEAHTPVGPGKPVHLRDTTTDPEIEHDGQDVLAILRQLKRVGVKDWALAALLRQGHHIVTRSGEDTGRMTPPNRYPDEAWNEAKPAVEAAIESAIGPAFKAIL